MILVSTEDRVNLNESHRKGLKILEPSMSSNSTKQLKESTEGKLEKLATLYSQMR